MFEKMPFQAGGQSYTIAAAASPPTPIQISGGTGETSTLIVNTGTAPVAVGIGSTAAIATANAVLPTVGSPSNATVIVGGGLQVHIRTIPGQYWTAYAASNTSIYLTPGSGS
jgi:hypothetical protein